MSWKRMLILAGLLYLAATVMPYSTIDKAFASGPEPEPNCWPWPGCCPSCTVGK